MREKIIGFDEMSGELGRAMVRLYTSRQNTHDETKRASYCLEPCQKGMIRYFSTAPRFGQVRVSMIL